MKKTVFLLLLAAMFAPWATQAQNYLLFQDFESTSLPADWTNEYGWSCTSRGTHGYGDYHVQNATGTSDNNKLISPVIDLSSVSFAKLSFMHCQLNSYGNHDQLKVFYRASPNDDWTLLVHYTGLIASWTEEVIELPNISSTYQIAFGMVYNYGPGVALDYVRVEEITCPRPVSLGVAGTTATTATLSWTERGNATAWQICLNDDENNLIDANTNPYTLTNLSTEIPYTAKVRAVCGTDEQSEWSEPISFEPTDKLVIGSGTATSGSLPTAFQWYYSMSEQIYTTAELGDEGTVLSIDFYCENNASYECTRTFDIYMVNTTRTRFDDDNDWVTVSSDDLVYRGYVSFPVGSAWKTITLDTPFEYDGTSNMLIAVRDYTWGYTNGVSCRTFKASSDDNQSRYVYDNYSSYDPTSPPTNGAGSRSRYKNQIRLLKVTCMPPAGLAASNVTNTSATLSWTERGDATSWVVEYADNSAFDNAVSITVNNNPTTTITVLTPESTYFARVKANCGDDDLSPWVSPISFTTDFCAPENKCEFIFELSAEIGMDMPSGWNGASIRVIDETDPDNEILLARLTIEEGNYYDYNNSDDSDNPLYNVSVETDNYSYARGVLPLCNGRDVRFEWENSNYGYDNRYSYAVYDADYNLVFSGTGAMNEAVEHSVSCTPTTCPRPTNVAVNYEGGTTAIVTWEGEASLYNIYLNGTQFVSNVTSPYALTVSLANTYEVRVTAVCDGSESHFSRPVNFTTDCCSRDAQCAISYELIDSYGNGWSGAAINIVDVASGIVLDTWTINSNNSGNPGGEIIDYKSGANDGSSASGTLRVCNNRSIQFVWVSGEYDGEYDNECYYTIYDVNGEELFSRQEEDEIDDGDILGTYLVDCTNSMPFDVAVDYDGNATAVVTWNGFAGPYNLKVNDDVISNVTSPYALNNLDLCTIYEVQVQSSSSNWTNPISFNTVCCNPEDQCAISYELYDSGWDGWNGSAIYVVDATSGIVLDTLTINYNSSSGGGEMQKSGENDGRSASGSLRVCNGREIQFVWESGPCCVSECSFTVFGVNGEELFSSSDFEDDIYSGLTLATYQVNCTNSIPFDFAVSYEGGTTAEVTWNGFAGPYSMKVNETEIPNVTSPYTLTNLELGTTYEVQVRNSNSNNWTNPIIFTTDMCMPEDMCEISYELVDRYNDGWDGNAAINVVDEETNVILATWTVEYGESPLQGSFSVCNGRDIRFEWVPGSCDNECSYTVWDVNGEEIFSGQGAMYDDEFYTVNCSSGGISIDANSWYAISAPKHDDGEYYLDIDNVGGLIPSEDGVEYDLFRYNESAAKWENQKESTETGSLAAGFSTLDCGRGYIYRRSASTVLSFDGNPYTDELSAVQTLTSNCSDADLKGFNLIGNPYQHSIYKGEDFDEDELLDVGYYSLNRDGSWLAHLDDDPIEVGQGVLVRVSGDNSVDLTFYDSEVVPAEPTKNNSTDRSLQFTVTGGDHKDVAFALFADREGLPKFGHLNAEAPSLSIPQGGTDYAIATINGSTQSFLLKFNSIVEDDYTLVVKTVSDFDYLHLIDKVACRDIDLLRQPTYTFTHTGNQALANRFMVKLSPEDESTDDIFAYQNGNRIVVEGTGTLQVYDVLGRQLIVREIESQASIHNSQFPSAGVYILRLNGKSQKLVIK